VTLSKSSEQIDDVSTNVNFHYILLELSIQMFACAICTHVCMARTKDPRERELTWQLGVREHQLKSTSQKNKKSKIIEILNIL
jgi:hypothetical protein